MIKSNDRYRSRSLTPTRNTPTLSPRTPALSSPVGALLESLQQAQSRIEQPSSLHLKLHQNGMVQRCLTHNNSISLYCCNEHRLLCVNCVYSGNKHKSHKVIPSAEATAELDRDVSTYSFRLAQKVQGLEAMRRTAEANRDRVGIAQAVVLAGLDSKFDEIARMMASQYLKLKTELNGQFEDMMEANLRVAERLRGLCGAVEAVLGKLDDKGKKSGEPAAKDPNIFKHLVLVNLVESLQVAGEVQNIETALEQIESQAQKQLTKLKALISKHKWGAIS